MYGSDHACLAPEYPSSSPDTIIFGQSMCFGNFSIGLYKMVQITFCLRWCGSGAICI